MVIDTFGEHAGRVLDWTATGVGIVAGAALIVGTGGTAAIVAAGAAGLYTAGRAGAEIYDEAQRGVDVFDMSNPENRSRWLEVAAGTLSVGAIGSGLRVANATRNGVQVTAGLSRTAAGLTIAADTADAVAMGDQALSMARNWGDMSNSDRAAGMLNIAFWGGMGVASTRAGGAALQDVFSFTRLDNTFRTGTPYPMGVGDGMAPGDIRVAYDVADNGRATDIRIETGPGAVNQDALALHTETARQIEAAGGLRDRLRTVLGGEVDPPVGSAAWEARLEIDMINTEATAIADELAAGGLSETRVAALQTRQLELSDAIALENARLTDAAANPNGFVAAPSRTGPIRDADGNLNYTRAAERYAEQVNGDERWSWSTAFADADVTISERRRIKTAAEDAGLIPRIEMIEGTNFANFRDAGVVEETLQLPREMWLESDYRQFKWLDEQLPNGRPEGYTWHHSEIDGQMELVPFGIHNITNHSGGRSDGMWADAER
jgi:hypothetical protein